MRFFSSIGLPTHPGAAARGRVRWVSRVCLALVLIASAMALLAGQGARAQSGHLAALTYKAAGDELRTRVVIMFDEKPDVSSLLLADPYRLVVDMPETVFAFDKKSLAPQGLVTGVRYGLMNAGRSRLILTLKGPFAVDNLAVLKNETESGYRLVIDVVATSSDAFEQAMARQNRSFRQTVTTTKEDRIATAGKTREHRFTVVLDPGHGGIDGGAQGVDGTLEKNVVLAVARKVRDALKSDAKIHVIMTRDSDVFLSLADRVRVAREAGADLFVSIHADSIHVRSLRGATVYTISDKASDQIAQQIADSENLADSVAGVTDDKEPPEVVGILADLTRRETHDFSVRFANDVVQSLDGGGINLISRPHRSAGFRVLKAPDVPSVLVELGYLSNPKDEKLLNDPDWRGRAAGDIAKAIREFAVMKTGTGG